jgi:hypothetical protein
MINLCESCLFLFPRQFKNFCRYLNHNHDILLYFLSKSFIYIKNKFREQADAKKNELNFLLVDPLIKKALVDIFILCVF